MHGFFDRLLEAVSKIPVPAKRVLRDALREARSVVWSFHLNDERQSSAPAKALPDWVSRHWPVCFVARLANDRRHWTRHAPRKTSQWPQKRGSRVLLRPLLINPNATVSFTAAQIDPLTLESDQAVVNDFVFIGL